MKYEQNKNVSLILSFIPIKSLHEGKKVLHSLIYPIIKEGDCSDAWNFFALNSEKESSHIKSIDFDQSWSPVEHADSFRTNIAIAAMHRLTDRILDISNVFQNTNPPIHERVYVSPPNYYLDWFERSYPNIPLNRDDGPFVFN